MRILQVLPPRPSEYEKKSQRIDFELLRRDHNVFVDGSRGSGVGDWASEVGGRGDRLPIPDSQLPLTLVYGRPPVSELPEAVEEGFFGGGQAILPVRTDNIVCPPHTIASFRRRSILSIVEQTMARLHRTRDDIEWLLLDEPPKDFTPFDAWIDPAVDEDDLDGFVAEAQVSGKIVVAARTAINMKRLEKGRTGLLVRPRDANELTHAILAALFKPEVAQQKIEAAQQTISKFHPRQRLRALMQLLK